MKKKNNLKEQREKAMQARISNAKAKDAEREEEKAMKALFDVEGRKSAAKASGLKSTFIIDNEIIMTSFGKGNSALLEKKIVDSEIENLNTKEAFEIKRNDIGNGRFYIKSQRMPSCAIADNPTHTNSQIKPGQDVIRCKDRLEKRYFGKTFDDNIHIQVIYNIMDIEKILAVHATNAVFAVNNILRPADEENDDFLGYMSTMNTYDNFIHYETNPAIKDNAKKNIKKSNEAFREINKGTRLGYFGSAFYYKVGKNKYNKKSEKTIYHILCLLGNLRQFCVHDLTKLENQKQSRTWIYNAEKFLNPEFVKTIDELYNNAVKNVDQNFVETNKVNLQILHKAMEIINGSSDWQKLTENYYGFLIEKAHKNIGFSIKRLREQIIADFETGFDKDNFNSVRSKLYKVIDFLIYSSYDDETISESVKLLRTCINDDEKVNRFYKPEAERLWNKLNYLFKEVITPEMEGTNIKALKDSSISEYNIDIESFKISKRPADYFSKIIYLLTMFLDGKEINDLLTTLINKFDNIASFIRVMSEMNLDYSFTDEYKFFENSDSVCSTLKLINSFARMESPIKLAKREMYREAIEILGTEGLTDDELEKLLDQVLCIDEEGNYISHEQDKNRDVSLRNFIANNVIENTRFIYLVRYHNARKTRSLASNEKVIYFLLHQIDKLNDKQIDRYYKSCKSPADKELTKTDDKIKFLAEKITTIDCSQFMHVKNNAKLPGEAEEKERLKSIVGLYLTIMYLITKNMVYINSRYVTAFHCLERDCRLYNINIEKNYYLELTRLFINPDTYAQYGLSNNSRARNYISQNIDNIGSQNYITEYRNAVAHLSVIKNMNLFINEISYINNNFELYHYIMQRFLFDRKTVQPNSPEQIQKYKYNLDNHNTYCKDFVKALNTPFGYNLARYKNLSIAELFDKNDTELKRKNSLRNDFIQMTDE